MATFSTLDSECINRTIQINEEASEISDENFDKMFDIKRSVEWIKKHGFTKVCLQLPDHLLPHSVKLCKRLKALLNMDVFVLADTTYNSCCIDEVSAQHIGADSILHYGHSCLSPHTFPVLDVYDKQQADVELALNNVKDSLGDGNVVLFYDVALHHLKDRIVETFFKTFPTGHLAVVPEDRSCTDRVFGRLLHDSEGRECGHDVMLQESQLVYLGREGPTVNSIAVCSQARDLYLADSRTCQVSQYAHSQWFKRRRYLIEKCKDARSVGVLVCTLSVRNYHSIITRLRKVVRGSGKKCYTLTVGKPNVAKLANLSEIEIFVLVACPENDLYNCRDFHSPIIYPYELELALNSKRDQFDTDYTTDFNDLLPQGRKFVELESNGTHAPDVSLITGNLRHNETPIDLESFDGSMQLDTVRKSDWAVQELGIGKAIHDRSWKGLEQDLNNSKPEMAVMGRKGIASGYNGEP